MASNPRYFTEGTQDTDPDAPRQARGPTLLQHGPPLSPDDLGALVDSKDILRVGHREARDSPPPAQLLPLLSFKVVADTF